MSQLIRSQERAEPDFEWLRIEEAAEYLRVNRRTLENWISAKRFTAADGHRHFGGLTRIHFPTLKARALAGKLISGTQSTLA